MKVQEKIQKELESKMNAELVFKVQNIYMGGPEEKELVLVPQKNLFSKEQEKRYEQIIQFAKQRNILSIHYLGFGARDEKILAAPLEIKEGDIIELDNLEKIFQKEIHELKMKKERTEKMIQAKIEFFNTKVQKVNACATQKIIKLFAEKVAVTIWKDMIDGDEAYPGQELGIGTFQNYQFPTSEIAEYFAKKMNLKVSFGNVVSTKPLWGC